MKLFYSNTEMKCKTWATRSIYVRLNVSGNWRVIAQLLNRAPCFFEM